MERIPRRFGLSSISFTFIYSHFMLVPYCLDLPSHYLEMMFISNGTQLKIMLKHANNNIIQCIAIKMIIRVRHLGLKKLVRCPRKLATSETQDSDIIIQHDTVQQQFTSCDIKMLIYVRHNQPCIMRRAIWRHVFGQTDSLNHTQLNHQRLVSDMSAIPV